MTTDDEFTDQLIGFGLSEKEAQLYLHLLKYGPKTPSPLARSLKTYGEDVHWTINALIKKGMVRRHSVRQRSTRRWILMRLSLLR